MRILWTCAIAAAALGAAAETFGQAPRDIYDLRIDALDRPSDGSRVKEERAELRRMAEAYSIAAVENGSSSLAARSAELDLDKAQIALHESLGDLRQDSWQAYVADRNLGAALKRMRRDSLARSLYDLRNDLTDSPSDSSEVRADRLSLRHALEEYADLLSKDGERSPQTRAARASVDSVQIGLHRDLGDYREDLWELLKSDERLQAGGHGRL